MVADEGIGAWLVLGFWLPIPVPSVNDLENETLVLKVDESASFEALIAPVPDEAAVSGDVVEWEAMEVDKGPFVVEVVGLNPIVAAPGPSPNAGALPTCFEVAMLALLFCGVEGRDGLLDGSGTTADVDVKDEEIADKDCLVCVLKVPESTVAAPGPSPNAGTLPTCFETTSKEDAEVDTALTGNVVFCDCEELVEA